MVRKTSSKTYFEIKNNGHLSEKRFRVYDIFYMNGDLTGSQVSKIYRKAFPSSKTSETIRNRITELVRMGVVDELGTTNCEDSGREVILFGINDNIPRELKVPKTMFQKKEDILKEIEKFAISHQITKKEKPEIREDLIKIYKMVDQMVIRRKSNKKEEI